MPLFAKQAAGVLIVVNQACLCLIQLISFMLCACEQPYYYLLICLNELLCRFASLL